MPDFIPRPDQSFATWSKNFVGKIQSDYASLGISSEQAADILSRYESFAESFRFSKDNTTRTPGIITRKDTDRKNLIEGIRPLARIIRAQPGITPQMLNDLGLPVPKQRTNRIGPPDEAPRIVATAIGSQRIRVELRRNETLNPKRKPDRATAAAIFMHFGETSPANIDQWQFHSNQSKTTFIIDFKKYITPGQRIWFIAYWISARAEKGPISNCTFVRLAGGEASPQANAIAA